MVPLLLGNPQIVCGCTPTVLSTGYRKCVVRALAVRGEGLVVKQVGPRRLGNLTPSGVASLGYYYGCYWGYMGIMERKWKLI